jgi:hypothetical protein
VTTDPELESKLRTLGVALAPSDGFADRVAAQIDRLPRPAARRRRALVPALAAAALLVAVSAAVFLARRSAPPEPTPGNESAAAPSGTPDGVAGRNPLSVAFSLTDLAYVNSKWGFIDRSGKVVIPARYSRVTEFSEGLAAVKVGGTHAAGGKWGFADRSGAEVIAPQFDWAYPFREGFGPVKVGEKWGFLDRAGKLVVPARFEGVERFAEGLAAVQENGAWGFIDPSGRHVIPPRFAYTVGFSEGLAAVKEPAAPGAEPRLGYVDRSGSFVIEIDPRLTYAGSFHEGRAAVARDGLWGFIDRTGKVVVEPRYATFAVFKDGRARVRTGTRVQGGKHAGTTITRSGSIGPDGRDLGAFKLDYESGVTIDPATGVLSAVEVDEAGTETQAGAIDFDRLTPHDGLYRVTALHTTGSLTYHTHGFVDKSGKVVITPALEDVNDFREGLAPFATGLDWKAVAAAGRDIP